MTGVQTCALPISLLQPPTVKELTAVATPTKDYTPSYTFKSSKAGTITYGGNCSSSTTSATADNNTITFTTLLEGTYSNSNLYVTSSTGVKGNTLSVSSFTVDTTAPSIAPVTTVTTPTNDPSYSFSSDEAGTISYGGSCSSSTTSAISGTNSISFKTLGDGSYGNCTITVTDSLGHVSSPLSVNTFVVDTTAPTLSQVTAVTSPTNDTTPSYTFSSNEAGTISYGGSCKVDGVTSTNTGSLTISFNTLSEGSYSNCTITVTDTAGNASNPLNVNTFIVGTTTTTGLVWDQGYWDFHKWQ